MKKKILLLGTHDSKLTGHIQATYDQIKDDTEAVMVTRFGFYGKADHCFWALKGGRMSIWDKIRYFRFSREFFFIWRFVYCLFRFGIVPVVNKRHSEYSFGDFEYLPFSARDIIKKCPDGFIPDIIMIFWSSRFISSKMIHDLYRMTKASIIYSFVDEAPMTGGCHYPNECKGYLSGCHNCPALSSGKTLAAHQMASKEKYLKDIPFYIIGSPYDMRLALKTVLFKNATPIPGINNPKVEITPQDEARIQLGISNDSFVVLIGAANVESVRKGFIYTVNALNNSASSIKNLIILVIGNTGKDFKHNFPGINVVELGFVSKEKMVLAYCASDCFLSTTIADSGPQMVNYSIATGTPVVSFSIGIAEDLVIHKKTGYIARFKDANDVASGIQYLHNLPLSERKTMSEECINTIKERSSMYISWKKLLGINSIQDKRD